MIKKKMVTYGNIVLKTVHILETSASNAYRKIMLRNNAQMDIADLGKMITKVKFHHKEIPLVILILVGEELVEVLVVVDLVKVGEVTMVVAGMEHRWLF